MSDRTDMIARCFVRIWHGSCKGSPNLSETSAMTYHTTTWDPFRDLAGLLVAFDHARGHGHGHAEAPELNLYASDDAAVVTAELPGVAPADVQVQLHDEVLSIAAQRQPLEAAGLGIERQPVRLGRSVQLPFAVDPDHVEARLKDGILTVSLRRAAADRPRRIAVSSN
jgi:HSP20 family protein